MHFCRCVLLYIKTIVALLLCAHLVQKIMTDEFERKKVKEGSKNILHTQMNTGKRERCFSFCAEIFTYSPEEKLF